MVKKVEPPPDEGLPPWLATFADLMSLLLCFFVLLLSMAKHDVEKYKTVAGHIQEAFGVQIKRPDAPHAAFSPTTLESKGIKLNQRQRDTLNLTVRMRTLVEDEEELKRASSVSAESEGVLIRVESAYLFEEGTAVLSSRAPEILGKLVQTLKEFNFKCVIRGHTDDREKGGKIYPSKWELSAARAAAALHYLVETGKIPAWRLKATGYADTRPLLPNDRPEYRRQNRRVEFMLHKPEVNTW